jgi:acyl-CoA hydrolase
MEIGARVETEDLLTGVKTHLASAYLTFVALGNDHRPTSVPPPLKLITQEKQVSTRKKAVALV